MTQRIVDSHVHWRDPASNPYEALSNAASDDGETQTKTAAARYLPKDYFKDSEGFEIIGFVHVEAEWSKSDPVGETRWLEGLARNGELAQRPLGIVGFADLADPRAEATLAAHAGFGRIRGIRQMLNFLPGRPALCWANHDYLADPLWRSNFGLLQRYGLDFDLMCFAHQMPAMAELASRHPDIRIHLEHCGMPWDHSDDGRREWREGMRTIAALKNSDLKISGLGNTIEDWNTDKIRDYVLEAIDIFGTDRVCFASNFPTDRAFSDMAAIWNAFQEIIGDFSQSDKDAMFAENALRRYRLST